MSSSDIYKVKESPWAKAQKENKKSRRRRRRRTETFDEVMNKDLSKTHRRRSKNSGFRRFRHQLKKPEYSKKFWTTCGVILLTILVGLVLWDQLIRYRFPAEEELPPDEAVEVEAQ